MAENPYTQYIRFQTPNPEIAPREQAPMLEQEHAWAEVHAAGHRFSWLTVLLPPLCFGPVLPALAYLVGLLMYRGVVDSSLDVDRIIGGSFAGLAVATALFTAAWVAHNVWRDKRDATKRYWQTMPGLGVVELERHTLVSCTNLWANDYDPECNSVMEWRDGKLVSAQDSGVSQWVVATTQAGYWLVLKKQYAGGYFTYDREGKIPLVEKQLHPTEDLAIAFAPGTNLSLGQRCSGAPVPVVNTDYWLASDENKRLAEVAHHWMFFPPYRYAVVDIGAAPWVQRLVEKAVANTAAR
jgi:hypothetical protein